MKHIICCWTKATVIIYNLILMEHKFNLLLCEQVSFIFLPQIYRLDLNLGCFENARLRWRGKRTENHKINCFSKDIQLCVLLVTATSMQEAPRIFNCTHLYYVKRKKIHHLGDAQGFCFCYYILVPNKPPCFTTSSLFTFLSACVPYVPNHPCAWHWQSHFLFSCYPWVVFQSFIG